MQRVEVVIPEKDQLVKARTKCKGISKQNSGPNFPKYYFEIYMKEDLKKLQSVSAILNHNTSEELKNTPRKTVYAPNPIFDEIDTEDCDTKKEAVNKHFQSDHLATKILTDEQSVRIY